MRSTIALQGVHRRATAAGAVWTFGARQRSTVVAASAAVIGAVVEGSVVMGAVVKTAQGLVRGVEQRGAHTFLGIPYAAAPVGERRFRVPRPSASWPGERDASGFGAVCLQQPMPGLFGQIGTPTNAPGTTASP